MRTTIAYAETTYVSGSPDSEQNYERTRNVVVDGWGTILLPGGKQYNVLRVRDTDEDADSNSFGGKEFRFLTDGGEIGRAHV